LRSWAFAPHATTPTTSCLLLAAPKRVKIVEVLFEEEKNEKLSCFNSQDFFLKNNTELNLS
jgi:hypothetical protein